MHPIFLISNDKRKPALYKLCNYAKEGKDIVDQKISFNSQKTKSRKWTTIAFLYLLDTCPIDAASVLAMINTRSRANRICLKLALVLYWN